MKLPARGSNSESSPSLTYWMLNARFFKPALNTCLRSRKLTRRRRKLRELSAMGRPLSPRPLSH